MKFGLLVIGPAGSGKSTFCTALQQHMEILHRTCRVVNLDPAAEIFLYKPFIDVRELITVEEAAEELGLGPNGALVYAMEFLQDHVDWLEEQLHECGEDEFFVFDCPGQIELYTHLPLMKNICTSLQQTGLRLAACCCLDISFMTDAAKLFGGSLMALSSMIQLELPHINLLTKCDLVSHRVSSPATSVQRRTTSASRQKHNSKKLATNKVDLEAHSSGDACAKRVTHGTADNGSSGNTNANGTGYSSSVGGSRSTGEEQCGNDNERKEEEGEKDSSRSSHQSSPSSSRTGKEVCEEGGKSCIAEESAAEEEDNDGVDEEEECEGDIGGENEGSYVAGLSRGIGFGVLSRHVCGTLEQEPPNADSEETTKEKAIDALLSRDPQQLLQQLDACTPPAYRNLNASFAALLEDYSLVSFLPCDITEEDSLSAVALALEQTLQFGEDLEVRETDIMASSEE